MSRREPDDLPALVATFFRAHLQRVRGASPHTVRAYRDALRLFFTFVAEVRRRPLANLRPADLDADTVLAFLAHLEKRRGNSPATRNCRLAALRSFFRHLLRHDPAHADQYHRILSLPPKRARAPLSAYLEPEEIRLVLAQPDPRSHAGLRDQALLLFLYNTGARVSEALAVRLEDLDLGRPLQVRLRGKGGRERLCPLWPDTARVLRRLVAVQPPPAGGSLFRNARGGPLTRDGVAYLLRKHLHHAAAQHPELRRRRLTPHMMRHSCAVALLQAGIDLTVIRDYLGHASVATTSRYVATNLQTKRQVLETFWRRAGFPAASATPWRPKPELLRFLASL